MPRMDLSSSALLHFYVMKDQKGIQTHLTQDQISLLEDLVFQDFSTFNISNTLFESALLFIRSEQIEGCPEETRHDFAFNLEVIRDVFERISKVSSLSITDGPGDQTTECLECIKKEGIIEHLQAVIDDTTSSQSSEAEGKCRTVWFG